MAKEMLITDLKASAQTAALDGFVKFYLQKFRDGELDVIVQIDAAGHVADINQWLYDNQPLSLEEQAAGLLSLRRENLIALLTTLGATFNASGVPTQSWQEWYNAAVAKIPQGR
ncbi:hypothetical protein [Lacticaseibacillus nasuensis]|uniref:Uncharacterized protein n=1 Tax=Lacticaseibacillus nasuensis JCM 17158 TaxID=1291734 RepID=A0A0R1JQR2_9LACO|nr:hypothetical protein [Lacticaseibacillus nasuensis]KRK70545.1 hypothetical protein FD02_GL000616 [Lacticaseibacillus nasuensis JCM 17158]